MPFKRIDCVLYGVSFVLLIVLMIRDTIRVTALAKALVQDILGLILSILLIGFGIQTIIRMRAGTSKKSATVLIAIVMMCLGLVAGYVIISTSINTTMPDIVKGPYTTTAYVHSINKRGADISALEMDFEEGKIDAVIHAKVHTSDPHVINSLKLTEKKWVKITLYRHSGIIVDWKQLDIV